MYNALLIEILTGFTDAEWDQLAATLPDKGLDLAQLFGYLANNRSLGMEKGLDKKLAFKTIFKGKPYNDQKMRDAMSALLALAKEVLLLGELHAQPYQERLLQVHALRKRGMQQAYSRVFNKMLKDDTAHHDYTEKALLYQYHLAQEREEYFALQQDRQPDQALQDRMRYLDHFYILAKLKLTCEQLNRMHILQADCQPVMLQEVLGVLSSQPQYLGHPGILLYYRVLQMLQQPEQEDYYLQLIADLMATDGQLNLEDTRNLYRYAQNYCIRMINQGQAGYFKRLLELYQKQLHNKLLLPNGIIDHTDYKNIVTVGLRLKDYEWTAAFINQYKPHLPEDVREAAWLYNHANYLYESGQRAQAGELLANQNFSDIYYNLSARHLLLKIFYDEQEYEALGYQIESFRLYLLRNKTISKVNSASNLNFLKVMKRLAKLKEHHEFISAPLASAKLTKIMASTQEYNPLANKNWLQEQANILKETVLK